MTIRGYRNSDIEACRALWIELTQWHRDIYEAPEIGGDDPAGYFDDHLARVGPENIWVADDGGNKVVGFAGMISEEETAELEPIVVSVAYRAQGVGRALARVVVEEARRRGLRQLITRPVARNSEAIHFFHSQGFEAMGQVELILDLVDPGRWRPGETIANRDFRV